MKRTEYVKRVFLTLMLFVAAIVMYGQPRMQKVQLMLVPDHSDALYKVGERVKMRIMAFDCGMALSGVTIHYQVSEDLMTPHKEASFELKGNEAVVDVGTMKKPGYLRVRAHIVRDGKKYSAISTVGFDTEELRPTVTMPDDFMAFWMEGLKQLESVELEPEMELLEERCTKSVDVYHISYANINGSRMYGVLTMPKEPGSYPAILRLPGAGVGEKGGDIAHAEKGAIILELGIHGIPVNLKGSVYEDLGNGVLADYPTDGLEDKMSYFYRRVYLGAVKGVDFLLSLPECNGKVGTFGGSQGGALSIVTSALDKRIAASVVYFPALCDLEGYTHGRAGGWPHMFKEQANCTPQKLETARYYDVSNFARCLKAPVYYAFGYNDITCAPTTTRSTYNVITAPKQLIIGENIGHWTYPEQMNALWEWIINELSGVK